MAYSLDDVHGAFTQALGRQASPFELDYFKKYLDNGSIQPFEIAQILGNHPEAMQRRQTQQQQEFGNYLEGQDQRLLNMAGQEAMGNFAALGRPDSSGISAQIISAGQNLASGRQNALANFYNQGTNRINDAYGQYGQQAYSRAYGLTDETRHRNQEIEDYYRQRDDMAGDLRGQSTRNLQSSLLNAGLSLPGQALGGYLGGLSGGKALNGLLGSSLVSGARAPLGGSGAAGGLQSSYSAQGPYLGGYKF